MALLTRRAVVAAAGTLAAVTAPRNSRAAELKDLAKVLIPTDPPREPPDGFFLDEAGQPHRLSEFAGRGMVINFWATWCQPCIAEMPSLAALAQVLGPYDIAVLPLSSDRGGAKAVRTWFQTRDVTGLPVLLDPKGAFATAFGATGIPATFVIGRDGLNRAHYLGAADWSSEAAAMLIRRVVEG